MSVTKKTRLLVLTRDDWSCQVCGRSIAYEVAIGMGYSLQHRRARQMGGTKRPETDLPANLVALCGSATSPGCHQRVENNPDWARDLKLRIGQRDHPAEVPVWTFSHGHVLLDDVGGFTEVDAPKETA